MYRAWRAFVRIFPYIMRWGSAMPRKPTDASRKTKGGTPRMMWGSTTGKRCGRGNEK
jgi:hypothetical protein